MLMRGSGPAASTLRSSVFRRYRFQKALTGPQNKEESRTDEIDRGEKPVSDEKGDYAEDQEHDRDEE